MQEIHRDHGHLFASDSDIGPSLPVYAVNVAVPLVDVDLATGPTGVWPGSHRWPSSMQARPEAVTAIPVPARRLHAAWTTAPSTPACRT